MLAEDLRALQELRGKGEIADNSLGGSVNYLRVFCMEDKYPGLWQRWFRHQCVAVGWCAEWGFKLEGKTKDSRGWAVTRNALKRIQKGDWILVQLKRHRVGRIGQVVGKAIEDGQWNPLVPRTRAERDGEMGRRINVRWDLNVGPSDAEMVVELPRTRYLPSGLARPTIAFSVIGLFDGAVHCEYPSEILEPINPDSRARRKRSLILRPRHV